MVRQAVRYLSSPVVSYFQSIAQAAEPCPSLPPLTPRRHRWSVA